MPHQPTVTKNFRNTQREFGSYLGSCDVSVAPRAVRLSTSSGTQLLLLPKGNSEVPLFFHFLNYPLYVCKPSKNCNPAALYFSICDHGPDSLHAVMCDKLTFFTGGCSEGLGAFISFFK